MQSAFIDLVKNIAKLINVKSFLTLALTATLIAMLVGAFEPKQEFVALFCTSYGCIITYFFTRKDKDSITFKDNDNE